MSILTEKNGIIFETIQQQDIEATAACISNIMSKSEPITRALQISEAEFHGFAIPYCHKAVKESVSLVAKDRQTGQIVGFIISKDLMTWPPERLEIPSDKFEPIFNLLEQLYRVAFKKLTFSPPVYPAYPYPAYPYPAYPYPAYPAYQAITMESNLVLESIYKSKNFISQGEVLHIFLLGVVKNYANKNIAKTLIEVNLKLAKQRNFKAAIVEATGLASQHIFRSFGFQEEAAIKYKTYKFNNKKILSTIENSEKCILMSAKI
ncbi:GNAT family N-acetyltransferase [Limnofasciculus baicalensis]|uniref:GNAT family N-acetyltransferase n=1 Tax=Limnofasciculus baicalensis BBK-W-15 TaxID=2699891 RepID=A0AAE3GMG2_9CYAN|nr:GNAT family N-acetyltransferase [Limnofasciculus baicalensis]MCP2727310.1 GNAT family N-acetyltransferase [Limnofasciculus baicalensis BBK-W-15]